MSGMTRRVVAGIGADGRAVVLSDGVSSPPRDLGGAALSELWRIKHPPRRATDGGDAPNDGWQLWGEAIGALAWRVCRFTAANQALHRTPSIDLISVLEGEIDLLLEDGPVRLREGDHVVIQACLHGWQLVDGAPCTIAALMITVEAP